MPLGLYPQETNNALDEASRAMPAGPPQPAWYAGSLTAPFTGIEAGAEGVEAAGESAATSFTTRLLAPFHEQFQRLAQAGGAIPETVPSIIESDPETVRHDLAVSSAKAADALRPNPATVGVAGQTLHGLASGITQFVGGTLATGSPIGGAALVGGAGGVETHNTLVAQGVDEDTATKLAAGAGLMEGGASLLPGGIGKTLAQRVVSGAVIQADVGMINRGMMHSVLEDAGYTVQAQQYKPTDGLAILSDAVLGSAFGGLHHYFNPSTVDAALTGQQAVHLERNADGVPIDPISRQNHLDNNDAALRSLMNDEPVTGMKPVDTVPNPHAESLSATMARELGEHVAEVTAPVVGPEGRQIEAFHGTTADFTGAYDTVGEALGPHFGTAEQAGKFATGEGANVRPVLLNFHNTLRLPDGSWENAPGLALKLAKEGIISDERMMELVPFVGRALNPEENRAGLDRIKAELIKKGYDSIVYKNEHEGPGDSYIALKPQQQVRGKFERRSDQIEQGRIAELAAADRAGTITPQQTAELNQLLLKDRLAASVNGRRMQGVQNATAYAEMVDRGEAKPIQGLADLDMFKPVNDTYGHATGDVAIRTFGQALAHYLGDGNVFHRGGDEFVLQHSTQAEFDAAIAKVKQYLENHKVKAYHQGELKGELNLRFSHGTSDHADPERAQELADVALQAEKRRKLESRERSEREPDVRPVAEKPGADRQAGNTQAAGTNAPVKSEAHAITELTTALRQLASSKGTDNAAHAKVRAILQSAADQGMDAAAIERGAVARAGADSGRVLEQAKASERPVADASGLDPATREAVEQAQAVLERRPDMAIEHPETGAAGSAHDALTQSVDDLTQAKNDGDLHQIAAACFGRA